MFSVPGIIIVDNEDNELAKMQDAFSKAGFPCLPIKYINDSENVSGIDHIEIPEFFEPRIIVSDLNLKDLTRLDAVTLCAPVAKIIQKIIKSGPYMLWIWSKHDKEPAQVIALLEERYKNNTVLPLHWTTISKNEFLFGNPENPLGLKEKILSLIGENSVFHALCDWEGRISLAARKTVNAIYQVAKPLQDNYKIENHEKSLKTTLAKIGNETLGTKNALDFPGVAMDLGLAPVLADQLLLVSDETNDALWKRAIPELGTRIDVSDEIKSKLNSFYHLEAVDSTFPKDRRGTFVRINKEYVNSNLDKFQLRLGLPLKTLLNEEFLYGNAETKAVRKIVRENVILGFLETSAECDQAQRKTKLHRYLLAVLIPQEYEKHTIFINEENNIERDKSHEGIYRFPVIWFNDKKYIMKLSFKYQIGTKPNDNKWLGDPILRVRDQILSEISFNCSQYSSRPGIVRFD